MSHNMRKSLSLLLSLLGLFDSLYLFWVYVSPWRPMVCLGTGCDAIRASAYSKLVGLPVPLYGVAAYSVLAFLIFAEALVSAQFVRRINYAVGVIAGAGFLFSLYLTYLEAFVVRAWCVWCIVSALAITSILALAVLDLRQPAMPVERGPVLERAARPLVVSLLALGIGAPAFYFLSQRGGLPLVQPPSAQTLRERLVRPESHMAGNPQAAVTVVEFGDFVCPACGQAERVVEETQARYGTRIRFVFRHFPLTRIHPQAEKAAEASECAAEQGKFWEAARKFYTWQDDLSEDALSRYAAQLGLDQSRFVECLASGSMAGRVRRDWEDGLALGVRATPTFFVGPKRIEGSPLLEGFVQLIDQELAAHGLTSGEAAKAGSNAPSSTKR